VNQDCEKVHKNGRVCYFPKKYKDVVSQINSVDRLTQVLDKIRTYCKGNYKKAFPLFYSIVNDMLMNSSKLQIAQMFENSDFLNQIGFLTLVLYSQIKKE
jgi:hypothetical protein